MKSFLFAALLLAASCFASCSSTPAENEVLPITTNPLPPETPGMKDTVLDARIPESVANPVSGNSLYIFLEEKKLSVELNGEKKEFADLAAFEKFLRENKSNISREGTRIDSSDEVTIDRLEELMVVLKKNGIEKWSIVGM